MLLTDIKFTEPKLKDFKCFRLPIDNLPKYKEVLIFGNVYNFFGTFIDDALGFTQTAFSGEGSADNFMNFGQFVMNGGHATIIASKETCNYYRRLYKEFYKAGFGTTHPKVTFFEIDDIKFLTGKFKVKEGKEEKIVKGEYFWSQNKKEEWSFDWLTLLKTIFKEGEKRNMAVIMNPPFGHSLHASISKYIYENWENANLLVLCPTSLLNGMSQNCIKAREVLKDGFSGFEYEGVQDFGVVKPNVSIFVFKKNSNEKISFEEKQKEFMSDEEISIRKKVETVDCWDSEKLSKTYNFTIEKRKWDDNDAFIEFLKKKLKWGDKKRVFVGSTSALYYKSILNKEDYPSYVAGYFDFETEEEAEEFKKTVSQPLYNQLLKIYSSNKRDLYPKQSKWPKSLESLKLTKEEIEWLNTL